MIRPIYPLRPSHFPTSILSRRILREQRALQSETDEDETLEYILVLFMYFGLSATKGALLAGLRAKLTKALEHGAWTGISGTIDQGDSCAPNRSQVKSPHDLTLRPHDFEF